MNMESKKRTVGKRRILSLIIGIVVLLIGSLYTSPVQAAGDQAVIPNATSDPAATTEVSSPPANRPPSGYNQTKSTTVNTPVSGGVNASDPDGDAMTFSICCEPEHGIATINGFGEWTYTPDADYTGWDLFKVMISDGKSGNTVVQVKILVQPANRPPTGEDDQRLTKISTSISGKVKSDDPDGDPLTHSLAGGPQNGDAEVKADGTYTYTPDQYFYGRDVFYIKISDGRGGEAQVSVTVEVQDEVIVEEITIPQDTSYTRSEYSGQYISNIQVEPQHGTVTGNSHLGLDINNWIYTPNKGFVGYDTFTIYSQREIRPYGPHVTKQVIVYVTPVQKPPVKTPPELPKTGSPLDRNLLYGAGVLMLGIGGWFRFRRKRT